MQPVVPPSFTQLEPPTLVAVDTHSVNLQWTAAQQQTAQGAPQCTLSYSLDMQLVSTPKGAPPTEGIDPKAWSCCWSGQGTDAQASSSLASCEGRPCFLCPRMGSSTVLRQAGQALLYRLRLSCLSS